jgi:hypothetical protein
MDNWITPRKQRRQQARRKRRERRERCERHERCERRERCQQLLQSLLQDLRQGLLQSLLQDLRQGLLQGLLQDLRQGLLQDPLQNTLSCYRNNVIASTKLKAAEHQRQLEAAEHQRQLEAAEHQRQLEAAEHQRQLEAAEHQRQLEAAEHQRQLEAACDAACDVNASLFRHLIEEKTKTMMEYEELVRRGKHEINLFVRFHHFMFGPYSTRTQEKKEEEKESFKKMLEKYPPYVLEILRTYFNETYCKKTSA